MVRLKNWTFKELVDFLKDYGFIHGHTKGSHFFYNGKINGELRVVQAINSSKERHSQSFNTMKLAIRHSGIPKHYFDEWKRYKKIYKEIIY